MCRLARWSHYGGIFPTQQIYLTECVLSDIDMPKTQPLFPIDRCSCQSVIRFRLFVRNLKTPRSQCARVG